MNAKQRAWLKARYEEYKKAYIALMVYYPFTLENLPGEIWRDIPNYEGHYQESNFGRTKSLKYGKEKILKPTLHSEGYLRIVLSKGGKMKYFFVHRLVGEIFVPNPENKPEVNHDDGCKLNNHFENLEWSTEKENIEHAVENGLIKSGEDNHQAKLTADQVREIRLLYIEGDLEFGGAALARKYGVAQQTIQRIVNYKAYKNVK